MDDQDGSIFALLAAVASGGDDVQEDALAYRELPPQHIWSENALVDAWAAAMNEFKVREGQRRLILTLPHVDVVRACVCFSDVCLLFKCDSHAELRQRSSIARFAIVG